MTQTIRASSRTRAALAIGTSTRALGVAMLLFGANAAWAQDSDPVTQDPAVAAEQSDIVVTGFRRSLETAVAEKKNRDQVVESVSAEDIGKLPDASIAESIARLPGLTSQRSAGRDTTISIRGFSPDFSTTLLNGREQTSTGDNRAVEYDQYPAEIINQVVVYKTPEASLVGQGLSGTVDLRTIRPLDFGRHVFSIGARGIYNDNGKLNADANKFGYRANAVFVDQFKDDTIGLSLAASYSNEPYEIKEFNAWGYFTPDATGNAAISGSKSYNTSSTLKRFGIAGTLQVKATPEFTSTVDGFYSHFRDLQNKRGIELPFSYFGAVFDPTGATASNGLYTSGAYDNVQGVVRNNQFLRKANLYSFGWNNAYHGDDGWNAMFDISYSKVTRNERDLESYSGTGYNWNPNGPQTDATDRIGFTSGPNATTFTHQLDYSDPNQIVLTDPLGWGGSTVQAGYNNNRVIQDRIWQYRTEVEKELESSFLSSLKVGLNYTNRDKTLDPQENFLILANGVTELTLPAQYRQTPTNLQYLGLGPILTYDPSRLIADGIYVLQPNNVADVYAKAYSIHEDVMTGFAQAKIKADVGSATLTGNVGVQVIFTNQKSNGNRISGPNLTPYVDGTEYTDVLPSLNLSLRFPGDFVVRVGAARELMRPRLDDMRASLEYSVTTAVTPTGTILIPTGTRGDPRLQPYRANAFDLTFEKYFGLKGYVAAQLFYKDLKSYVIENVQVPYDFTGFVFTGQQPTTTSGFITQPINTKGGHIYGAEVAATIPFAEFSSSLDGFGVTGSASYTKAENSLSIQGSTDLPGYSKWVASGTGYFEKWGFSARGSIRYRSSFRGEVVGFGDSRELRYAYPETVVDAQIGYDFGSGALNGLSIYFQGQNLTDAPFVTYLPPDKLRIIDYQKFGRRFLAGFTYKF